MNNSIPNQGIVISKHQTKTTEKKSSEFQKKNLCIIDPGVILVIGAYFLHHDIMSTDIYNVTNQCCIYRRDIYEFLDEYII